MLTIFKHSIVSVTASHADIAFDEYGVHITGLQFITD